MRFRCITLKNFRCFGSQPVQVSLDEFTTFIGSNGSGKSAVLAAFTKLFGVNPGDRGLRRDDFHISRNQKAESIEETDLYVEVEIEFPELLDPQADLSGIPEFFQHMVLGGQGEVPYCRIRLEGKYVKSGLPEGEIEERLWWVTTVNTEIQDSDKVAMRAQERARIHVIYVPATREPSRQLKNVSGTHLSRLLGSIKWSDAPKNALAGAAKGVQDTIKAEAGLKVIHKSVTSSWGGLHDKKVYAEPRLQFMEEDIDAVIAKAQMVFHPSEDGGDHEVDRLSDGQKSLLYFALISSIFDIESALTNPNDDANTATYIDVEVFKPAVLRIFAVEEAENHLSPHYLSRIIGLLKKISDSANSQTILTSHSPSILGRISPEQIRHFRMNETSGVVDIRGLRLPLKTDEAFTYVKEAVKAHPELYFSKLVILGEGDSEEIVIPKVARSYGIELDPDFISMVPLGGKHVNHFWKLLTDLGIPYITLLDFDLEREGGGWGRIKYVCNQLIANGRSEPEVLSFGEGANKVVVDKVQLETMHNWNVGPAMVPWITHLEKFGVFFSAPIDLDFLMLTAYKTTYQSIEAPARGPRLPTDAAAMQVRIDEAMRVVLGQDSRRECFVQEHLDLMPWYTYLFLGKGKPVTHFEKLNSMNDAEIRRATPDVLKKIVEIVRLSINEGKG